MQRVQIEPRPDWQQIVESQGFHFHTLDEQPYWDESVFYRFTRNQIDELEAATYALDEMCLKAVQHVIDHNQFERFQIAPSFAEWIRRSWERDEATIYGRFDLAYDGHSLPKLLEYNADTPTSLLEAAVIQWYWMKDVFPTRDQFNSIHERLIDGWRALSAQLQDGIWFTSISGNIEDYMTVNYLRDVAMQAGLRTRYLEVERLGWNEDARQFRDEDELHIANCFKLYPWEWMVSERFGNALLHDTTYWLESPWKMLLSNKAILVTLWELFPDSPYLLPASLAPLSDSFVRKPMLAREGANIQIVVDGVTTHETGGDYDGGVWVYQQYHPLPLIDGSYPLIGSWMVNGYACGIGIREDTILITGNTSRFVPHIFI